MGEAVERLEEALRNLDGLTLLSMALSMSEEELDVELSEKTPVLSTAHHPLGKPGGPGLWGVEGMQLPAYIQNIARSLMKKRGMPESRAIATAKAAVTRWASGAGKVSAEVRAASQKALAEWEAKRARAKATP